jgi:diguanylate cyclase (GGDEF)-like protein
MLTSYIRKTNPFVNVTILQNLNTEPSVDDLIRLFKAGINDFYRNPWDTKAICSELPDKQNPNKSTPRKIIFIDDLTGLYNTRYLNLKISKELRKTINKKSNFSILFIDVDNFKSVNEKYGHIIASTILKLIGRFIKENTRETDLIFRYGGDEFVILLPDMNTDEATLVAERIRKMLSNKKFLIRASEYLKLTVCIGVASFPEDGNTTKKILELADRAMFLGKKSTKNVVYTAKKLLYN